MQEYSENLVKDGLPVSEHRVVRLVAAEAGQCKMGLAKALTQLGWTLLSEQPLRARHGARKRSKYYLSANVLEYAATMTIECEQHSSNSSKLTLVHEVRHGGLGKGDWQSLTRESEAIVALALAELRLQDCSVCGATRQQGSRYCRQCGAPMASPLPAEVELMHLTAGLRDGHQYVINGLGCAIFSSLLWLSAFLVTPPGPHKVLTFTALCTSLFSAWVIVEGVRRIHLTLNPRHTETPSLSAFHTSPLPSPPPLVLLPKAAEPGAVPHSITEPTTALLAGATSRDTDKSLS